MKIQAKLQNSGLTVALLALVLVFLLPFASNAKPSRASRKLSATEDVTKFETTAKRQASNTVAVEILGRSVLYGLTYERAVSENIAVGAGLSSWSFGSGRNDMKWFFVPVFASYYFSPFKNQPKHRAFASGGLEYMATEVNYGDTSVTSTDSFGGNIKTSPANPKTTATVPMLGGGYEYRHQSGLLFRASAYAFIFRGGVFPWAGLSFGAAF